MPSRLDAERSEVVFEDYKGRTRRRRRRWRRTAASTAATLRALQACPTHIDIPEFIRKISTGNVKGAARTIFDANILGTSCARVCPVEVLCVGDCV